MQNTSCRTSLGIRLDSSDNQIGGLGVRVGPEIFQRRLSPSLVGPTGLRLAQP